MTEVWHVGPSPDTVGGMASVIRELCRVPGPGLTGRAAPTWWPGRPWASLGAAAALSAKVMLQPQPPLLHVHLSEGGSFLREGAVLLAGRTRRRTTAVTLHGAEFEGLLSRAPWLVRFILRRADVVLTLGPETSRAVADLLPGARVSQVLNPVEVLVAPEPYLSRRRQVVFAGEVGRRKGFDRLLQAWDDVRRHAPDWSCVALGPLVDKLPTLPPGMTYGGVKDRIGCMETIASSRLACLPSRAEVLPMFLLESLCLGTPVVATPVGEIPVLAGSGACFLTDAAATDLADVLTAVIRDESAAAQASERGRAWVGLHATPEAVGKALVEAYRGTDLTWDDGVTSPRIRG